MQRDVECARDFPMPWEVPVVATETAREASGRLGLSPRALIRRAVARGCLASAMPGRPREGMAARLAPTVWDQCTRPFVLPVPPWTPAELATLAAEWPTASRERLHAIFPARTWFAMRGCVTSLRKSGVVVNDRRAVVVEGAKGR